MKARSVFGLSHVFSLSLILVVSACTGELASQKNSPTHSAAEIPIVPPATPPLSRSVIGHGVISVSYTHVVSEPSPSGFSLGYLRKGAIVEVLERRSVNSGGTVESWVFVGGAYRGWLREDVIQVYDNEAQARTAAESLIP
jgi:hypothetical protein